MAVRLTEDQQIVGALGDAQLVALDAGEGLERRARGAAALRAVAVQRVAELVGDVVVHGAAVAAAGEGAATWFF